MSFYAVHKGNIIGIFDNWNDCKNSVDNYNGAIFKKFNNEHDAKYFVLHGIVPNHLDNFQYDICVYTDGSCINNGKPNAMSGIGIYFGENDPRNTSKRINGKQTNNTAELSAIIVAYDILKTEIEQNKNILFVSDSQYSIQCCTTFGQKVAKNNFPKETKNLEYIKKVYRYFNGKDNIKFLHIPSHTNNKDKHSIGNMYADLLANKAIGRDVSKSNNKVFINVKYEEKDKAKLYGCRWDPDKKSWYYTENNSKDNIDKINELFQ